MDNIVVENMGYSKEDVENLINTFDKLINAYEAKKPRMNMAKDQLNDLSLKQNTQMLRIKDKIRRIKKYNYYTMPAIKEVIILFATWIAPQFFNPSTELLAVDVSLGAILSTMMFAHENNKYFNKDKDIKKSEADYQNLTNQYYKTISMENKIFNTINYMENIKGINDAVKTYSDTELNPTSRQFEDIIITYKKEN